MKKFLIVLLLLIHNSLSHSQSNATKTKLDEWMAMVHKYKSTEVPIAIQYLDSCLVTADNNKLMQSYFDAMDIYIEMLCNISDYNKADSLLNAYRVKATSGNDQKFIAKYNLIAGNYYSYKDDIEQALEHYERAYLFYNKYHNSTELRSICISFASLYNHQGMLSKSLEYSYRSLALAREVNDTVEITSIYSNMIESYENLNLNDSIGVILPKYKSIVDSYKDEFMKNVFYVNYAAVLCDSNQLDLAKYHLDKSWKYFNENNMPNYLIYTELTLARLEKLRNNPSKADYWIQSVSKYLDPRNGPIPIETKVYYNNIVSYIYKSKGDFEKAYATLEESYKLMDSLRNDKIQKLTSSTDMRLKKMDFENKKLSAEVKIANQNKLILFLSFLLGVLIIASIFYFSLKKKDEMIKLEKIYSLEKEKEFIKLESQLTGQLAERNRISKEIHDDLGSSLTSISLLTEILKKKVDVLINPEVNKISVTSNDMVDKMNEIIWSLNNNNDTIQSLVSYAIKFASNILSDAQIEFNQQVTIENPNIYFESNTRRNIYLCIKEAIHNIVKHSHATHVNLNVVCDSKLRINIKDNGIGFNLNEIPNFRNGLANMRKRIEEIGGEFSITNIDRGTVVSINYIISNEG